MTDTNKPVQRITVRPYSVLFRGSRNARPIVVRIDQGDIIRFREKGRRGFYDAPIQTLFEIAVKCSAGWNICFVPGPSMRKGKGKK